MTQASRLTIAVLFAAALGHLAWGTFVGPPLAPDYLVGGDRAALAAVDPDAKQLYLRRELHLSRRPRHAWLEVLGRDRLRLYVNGLLVAEQDRDGFPVALLADVTPYLDAGRNVIAVAAARSSLEHRPAVAVEGACEWEDGRRLAVSAGDEGWRCSQVPERGASWWFSPKFDAAHWPAPRLVQEHLRARAAHPLRSITIAPQGRWITPVALDAGAGVARRQFDLGARPRQGWLRVTATSPYRLAINGEVVDRQEDVLGTTARVTPVQRTYDITPMLQRGPNAIALAVTSAAGSVPHIMVDGEVEDAAGNRHHLRTDGQWLSATGVPTDWLSLTAVGGAAGEKWVPCRTESGDLGVPPWQPLRARGSASPPPHVALKRVLAQTSLIAALAVAAAAACGLVGCALWWARGCGTFSAALAASHLALVLPTVAVAAALLVIFDPRIAPQDVYDRRWVELAAVTVPAQWGALLVSALAQRVARSFARTSTLPRPARTSNGEANGRPHPLAISRGPATSANSIASATNSRGNGDEGIGGERVGGAGHAGIARRPHRLLLEAIPLDYAPKIRLTPSGPPDRMLLTAVIRNRVVVQVNWTRRTSPSGLVGRNVMPPNDEVDIAAGDRCPRCYYAIFATTGQAVPARRTETSPDRASEVGAAAVKPRLKAARDGNGHAGGNGGDRRSAFTSAADGHDGNGNGSGAQQDGSSGASARVPVDEAIAEGDQIKDDHRAGVLVPRAVALPAPTPRASAARAMRRRGRLLATMVALLLLVLAGGWLRLRDLATEPLQWDEVENYQYTLGLLERGFPSRQIHPDLPVAYVHTSELMFAPAALAALLFGVNADAAVYIVRFPSACWGILTILLIYWAGRHLFGRTAGLIAAALYALAPVCISMSNFGRYFSQLQFLTLLCAYCCWLAIRGGGPIKRGPLWGAAISFIAAFLTWEGVAMMAPAMALAALVQRRRRLGTIFRSGSIWAAVIVVLLAVAVQHAHVLIQQSQFLWYGTSLSDLRLRPMWRYGRDPWYYVWACGWSRDGLIPLLGLLGGLVLAVRHRRRRAVRWLLTVHVGTCLLMALLVPAIAWRYGHHLIPFAILLAAAAVASVARHLMFRSAIDPPAPVGWRLLATGVAGAVAVIFVALGSGATAQLLELRRFRVEGYGTAAFKFPNLAGPAAFVSQHIREGDVLLATDPFHVNHFLAAERSHRARPTVDYWLATQLRLSATLDDRRPLPLDRRDGTPMIPDLPSLATVFNRHRRIWYVMQPQRHDEFNQDAVSAFLRQHMEVVYEDFEAIVLFRGSNHRPAALRRSDERSVKRAARGLSPTGVTPHSSGVTTGRHADRLPGDLLRPRSPLPAPIPTVYPPRARRKAGSGGTRHGQVSN